MKYFLCVLVLFVLTISIVAGALDATVLAWGNQGHEIVAIIATDNLSPAASKHVAESLGSSTEVPSLESAMAAAPRSQSSARPGVRPRTAPR